MSKNEFGDFQTPITLARKICLLLCRIGVSPLSVVDPTCGTGNFLRVAMKEFAGGKDFLGFEINPEYAQISRRIGRAKILQVDFFSHNWHETFNNLGDNILVIGNPPWITNSELSSVGGNNLPNKSNFHKFSGIEAITGKSNFDISEWMLIKLLQCLSGKTATLAMLCKTTVARKVLKYSWQHRTHMEYSAMYLVDSTKYFSVAVEACLLVCKLKAHLHSNECNVFPNLSSTNCKTKFSLVDGQLVANVNMLSKHGQLLSKEKKTKWRSGIKHDCVKVMELSPKGKQLFENRLGEKVSLESIYLYPVLKSSDLAKKQSIPSRYMLVTQQTVGECTSSIQQNAPKTWQYLCAHGHLLDGRASSIYRKHPRFSIFGVGRYSFTPWKVAIAGFYKQLIFKCIGPFADKPVVFDDTCYFLPCNDKNEAKELANLLNSNRVQEFYRGLIFWDQKRPITAQLLANLDLSKLR